jgi:DNA-binding transcriptional MerR regulator
MTQGRLYTVTELAKELGMTARAVRFYEDKGLITPQRAGTTRVYSARDRARMILILRGKRLGFALSEIKEYLDLYDADVTQHAQLRGLLAAVAKRRAQLLGQRQAIDEALAELADIAAQSEAALKIPAPRAKRAASG